MFKNSSFEYFIDPSAHCFFMKHYGVFDYDIVTAGNKTLENHKDFRWNLNRLVDVTNCELGLSREDILSLSQRIIDREEEGGSFRGAYIVNSSLAHGFARMFESHVSSPANQYQIYNSHAPNLSHVVREWLFLDTDYKFPKFLSLF